MCSSQFNVIYFFKFVLANEITLYRKNKTPMVWPLGSLRRYGYDAVFFTFECGRRCETGEGVFSFKCQRADVLFHTLQAFISSRAYHFEESMLHDFPMPNASNRNIAQLNSLNLNGTLQTTTQGSSYIVNARPNSSLSPVGTNSMQSRSMDTLNGDYLEPNPSRINPTTARLSNNLRLSSLGSEGSPMSPSSPNSYSNILEITNLNPLPPPKPHGNIYLEHPLQSHKPPRVSLELPQEQAPTITEYTESKKDHNMNVYMNAEIGAAMKVEEKEEQIVQQKPQKLATLAKMESLEIEPDSSSSESNFKVPTAAYMNVNIGEENASSDNCLPPVVTTPPVLTNNLNSVMNEVQKDYTKNVNGNIFGFTRASSFSQDASHCYQNLTLGVEMKPIMTRSRYSRPEIFSKVDLPIVDQVRNDRSEPCTPTQRKVVNYIVLDLDQTTMNNNFINSNNNNFNINGNNNNGNESTTPNDSSPTTTQMVTSISMISGLTTSSQHPESPNKKLGYVTIDFDRSNALSNILSNTPINDNDQSCRKTRHDSNVTPILQLMREHSSFSD